MKTNAAGFEFVVCTKCRVHHYENCYECAGFGMIRLEANGLIVFATAEEGHTVTDAIRARCSPCPECGSTIDGVPKEAA